MNPPLVPPQPFEKIILAAILKQTCQNTNPPPPLVYARRSDPARTNRELVELHGDAAVYQHLPWTIVHHHEGSIAQAEGHLGALLRWESHLWLFARNQVWCDWVEVELNLGNQVVQAWLAAN